MTEIAELRAGYRGYVFSRPFLGERAPQAVQNLVIRDYANRNNLFFKLSATEYTMPSCYMMLKSTLAELPSLQGIILYSLFLLPPSRGERRSIYKQVLTAGGTLHAALENLVVASDADIAPIEDIWMVRQSLEQAQTP